MGKIKFLLLFICFVCLQPHCFSQDLPGTKNAIYFELFGNGGLYSINYERNIHRNIYCRIGYSSFQTSDIIDRVNTGRITTVPVLVSFLSGHIKHHFEIGGGLLLGKKREGTVSNPICDITSFIGYRYQALLKGFLFRAGITPLVSVTDANYPDSFMISAGVSIGYHF